MDDLLNQLSLLVQSQDWLSVTVVAVLVLLSAAIVVLKALGKIIPILGTILELGKGLLKVLPKKTPPPPADPAKDGLAAVVKIDDKRDPPKSP